MKSSKVNVGLLGLLLMTVVHQADATIHTWSFEDGNPSSIFAFLDFDDVTSDFTIRDNPLNNDLERNAGVNGIAFDFQSRVGLPSSVTTSSIGQFNYSITTPSLPAGFSDGFVGVTNRGGQEVNDGEFTIVNFGTINFANINGVALRFNNNNARTTDSGNGSWITGGAVVAAVPEPQTYAMFLAGLGLMGFAARRKQG